MSSDNFEEASAATVGASPQWEGRTCSDFEQDYYFNMLSPFMDE